MTVTEGGLRAEVIYPQAREAGKGSPKTRPAPGAPQGGGAPGRNDGAQQRPEADGGSPQGDGPVAGWSSGPAGAFGTGKKPGIAETHNKYEKDIKNFSRPTKEAVADTMERLSNGQRHTSTHPLPTTHPGWFCTKVGGDKGTLMIHRTHEDGHLYVGGVFTQHAYDQAKRRLGSLYVAAVVYGALAPGYEYRHVVDQAKFGEHRYGDEIPPPSQEDVYNSPAPKWAHGEHQFQHQITRNGMPVAKLAYTIDPGEPDTLHVDGLATHPAHTGKDLASTLMDHMQDHAREHGYMIDHGTRTKHGAAWFAKYVQRPEYDPAVHHPSSFEGYGDDKSARDFGDHQFDSEEMKRGYEARRVYAEYSWQATGDWVHHYANQPDGWEHQEPEFNTSLGRGRQQQQGQQRLGRLVVANYVEPLPEEEQEARLSNFKEQSQPQGHPSDHMIAGARSYNAARGMGDPHDIDYSDVRTTADNTRNIGRAYHALPEHDPKAVPHYEALRQEIHQQYHHLTNNMGINVQFQDEDPYKNSKEMMEDVNNNKTLKVLKTAGTGSHPYFSDEENDKFRAIHDAFGHAATGRGFDKHGEEAAFTAHSKMFSPMARKAMATETRGQNHFYNLNGKFAQQKVALLPEEHQSNAWTQQ